MHAEASPRRSPLDVCGAVQDGGVTEATGYDQAFLSVNLPMPCPVQVVHDLPYVHFSVLLDAQRRLAAVTAVNIDGATLLDIARTGEWQLDPRVPAAEQAGTAVYAANDLDRGHLVRRRDPGWGDTAQARAATEATFVYTNAAPQVNVFNQSKDLWLGLEDHVLAYADANDLRVSVFTAPVLGDDDPPYRDVRIPLRFWKIAAWVSEGALAAAGFVLDQTSLVETVTVASATAAPLARFRTFQVPIAEIAALSGVDFGALVAADVLDTATLAGDGWRELRQPGDILL
jgi:endonuclease G